MGMFSPARKKRKSIRAQINNEKRLIAKKAEKNELARLRKQRRGY